jgi:hypothetical protein
MLTTICLIVAAYFIVAGLTWLYVKSYNARKFAALRYAPSVVYRRYRNASFARHMFLITALFLIAIGCMARVHEAHEITYAQFKGAR